MLEELPSTTNASIMRQFEEIQHFGVTELLPGRVRFGWKNDFTAFAPKKHFMIGNEDGAAIHGFWKEGFDKAFYIYRLQEVIEGNCPETGERFYLSSSPDDKPPQNFNDYREIDEKWIGDRSKNAFVARANENLNMTNKTNGTLPMYLEEVCFYRYIDDIFDTADLAKKHGTAMPWNNSMGKDRREHYVLNAVKRAKPKSQPLQSFIDEQLKQPETLLFVHFKDDQDALCQAQSEFLNMMSFYMKESYENLNIKIVDVTIGDFLGNKPYLKEWQEYFADNMLGPAGTISQSDPAPFVMVLGKPSKESLANQKAFIRRKGNRLLDFDLFQGCRGLLTEKKTCNWEANDLFKKNLRQAIHETLRCAGLVTHMAKTYGKDYRGWPEHEAANAIWDIEANAVVIKVHTKENGISNMALKVCNHLKLTGCPYVAMVIADGPEDVVEVHNDTDNYAYFSDADDSDGMFWSVEQAAREQYASHALNGASPFLLKPEISKDHPEQRTPEIFTSLKKPLH